MKAVSTKLGLGLLSSLVLLQGASAEVYKIDPKTSTIIWTGTKATGSSHTGTINFKEGALETKGADLKSGHFSVDMNTLTDTDLAGSPEYKAKLEGHLKSDDFFKVSQYPESTFKATSIEKKGEEYLVKGDLTMLGVTKPLEFPAKVTMKGDELTGDANVKLNRTNWGLKYGSKSFFKELVGDKIIKDEFDLVLKINAKKEAAKKKG